MIKKYFSTNKHLVVVLLCLVVVYFLTTNNLASTLDFNGDLGRDALVAKRIALNHKFTLVGPRASGGEFYLGPLYYYLITPSLLIGNLSPLSSVYNTVIINLVAILLLYLFISKLCSKDVGLSVAILYSFSSVTLRYVRVSGNYTVLPLFSIIAVFLFIYALEKKNYHLIPFSVISFSLALQLHYSALIILMFWLTSLLIKKVNPMAIGIKSIFLSLIILLFSFLPLLLFDIRHNWINIHGVYNYVFGNTSQTVRQLVMSPSWNLLDSFSYYNTVFWRVLFPNISIGFGFIFTISVTVFCARYYKKIPSLIFILVLFYASLIMASIYKGYLAEYYLIGFYFVPILLFILAVKHLFRFKYGLSFTVICILLLNIRNYQPVNTNRSLNNLQKISGIIVSDLKDNNKSFNIFLIRDTPFWSTASEYRYLTEIHGKIALGDTEYKDSEILYVIDEKGGENPMQLGNWEVQEFRPDRVEKVWKVNSTTIYRLAKK